MKKRVKYAGKENHPLYVILILLFVLFFILLFIFFILINPLKLGENLAGRAIFWFGSSSVNLNNCPGNNDFINPESIIPKPQNITGISCSRVIVNNTWKVYADLTDYYENFTANYLLNKTLASTGINLAVDDLSNIQGSRRIIIGNPNTNSVVSQIAVNNGINFNSEITKGFNQGYVLLIKPDEILILANSTRGTFYGMISLLWLLNKSGSNIVFPNVKINDWPDLEVRGYMLGWSHPENDNYYTNNWTDFIENLTMYKYNMWVTGNFNIYKTSTLSDINKSKNYFNYVKDRHFFSAIDLSPKAMLNFDNRLYEGFYAYNFSMRFNNSDFLESSDPEPVFSNPGFEEGFINDAPKNYSWNSQSSSKYNWSLDCAESHSGSCSIYLNVSEKIPVGNASRSFMSDRYEVIPGHTYIFSFWSKKKSVEETFPAVVIQIFNSSDLRTWNGVLGYVVNVWESDDVWRQYKTYYVVVPQSLNKSYIGISAREGGGSQEALEWWIDDIEIVDVSNKLKNIFTTNSTRVHIWNKNRTEEFVEGVDYQRTENGNYKMNDPLNGKTSMIKRINSGNIPANADVLIDYDFLMQSSSPLSFAEPLLYPEWEDMILKPNFGNLSFDYVFFWVDEISGINRDSRSRNLGQENYELLANYINNVTSILYSYNPNLKLLVWDDMLNPLHNGARKTYQVPAGGPYGSTGEALDFIDKNSGIVFWAYGLLENTSVSKKIKLSPSIFEKYGYNEWYAGPGVMSSNILQWSYMSYKYNASGSFNHEPLLDFYLPIGKNASIIANYSWNTLKSFEGTGLDLCDELNPSELEDKGYYLYNDTFNCGSCNNVCYYPRAYQSCVNSSCHLDSCFDNFYNANKILEDGCECSITNNGKEICDSIDNDCNGETDEGLFCSISGNSNGNGGGGGGGGITTNKSNRTSSGSGNANAGLSDNSKDKNLIDFVDIEKPMSLFSSQVKNLFGDQFKEFIKKNIIYEIIGLIALILIVISMMVYTFIKRHLRHKKRLLPAIIRINEFRNLGYSDDKIRDLFLEKGWDKNIVEKLLKE